MGMMGGPMGAHQTSDGWGKWEATSTVVLNADADSGRDGSTPLLGSSVTLSPRFLLDLAARSWPVC